MSRRPLSTLLGALTLSALVSCARRESPVTQGNRTQTLHVGNLAEPNDLDPAYPDSVETVHIVMALMEGLAQYDARSARPVPAGATAWETSADGLQWTFHLRPEARWSNGDPVTARDYVYAYRRMLSPGLGAEYAYMQFALKNGRAYYAGTEKDFSKVGAAAPDDHTLVLSLDHPVTYLAKLVCHCAWYPAHQATIERFGKIDQRGTLWTRPGNYVGNGPFVLAEWRPNQVIRVTRSPTYWNRAEVKLNEVDFYPVEDTTSEEAMFRNGQLHLTDTIPINKIAVYHADSRLRPLLHEEPMLGTYFYRFNCARPPLDDVRVRRALSYAINRQDIVKRVTLGGQTPAGHLTPPPLSGAPPEKGVGYDPEKARRSLAEAGYPAGKGFPQVDILYNTNEGHRKIAEAIQQMWRRELGINVGLNNQESKVQSDSMRQGNYAISRFGWFGDYLDPSTFLDIMAGDSGNNQTGWKNAEFDRLIEEARRTPDEARREALFSRCEEILADECPIMPVYFYVRDNLVRPEVKGWYGNPLDLHPYPGVSLSAAAP